MARPSSPAWFRRAIVQQRIDLAGIAQRFDLGGDVIALVGDNSFQHPHAVFQCGVLDGVLRGFFAAKKPGHLYTDRGEQKFWQGVRQSPSRTAREVRAQFRDIDRRLAEVETFYVSSNPRLSAEIERLR